MHGKSGAHSNSEKITIVITDTDGLKICGTDKYPGEYPARVVVKPL